MVALVTAPVESIRTDLRFIILGARMSGILSAIELKEAGLDNVAIHEKADGLGGTWRENTYPGIACDVPCHSYCYSFAVNPEWSHRLSPRFEIEAYFEDVGHRHELRPDIARAFTDGFSNARAEGFRELMSKPCPGDYEMTWS
jgi:cation diffusion facilitator CzcD-associated flavoprotein CzcO